MHVQQLPSSSQALPSHWVLWIFCFSRGDYVIQDSMPSRISRFIPIPMIMAIPFYIGAYFAIDMFVGSVILFVWERVNKKDADVYAGGCYGFRIDFLSFF